MLHTVIFPIYFQYLHALYVHMYNIDALLGKGLPPANLKGPLPAHQEPAGANGPVITGHCRRTRLFAGDSMDTAGAPSMIRRQRTRSTGAPAAAPAVVRRAMAHASCAGSRSFRCAGNKFENSFFSFFPAYYNTYLTAVYIYNAVHIYTVLHAI
jgi:hypothetical protein